MTLDGEERRLDPSSLILPVTFGENIMSETRRAWTPEKVDRFLDHLRLIKNELKNLVASNDELVAVIAKALSPVENGKAEEVEK